MTDKGLVDRSEWYLTACQADHGESSVVMNQTGIVCSIPSAVWNPAAKTRPGSEISIETDRMNVRVILEAHNMLHALKEAVEREGRKYPNDDEEPEWMRLARASLARIRHDTLLASAPLVAATRRILDISTSHLCQTTQAILARGGERPGIGYVATVDRHEPPSMETGGWWVRVAEPERCDGMPEDLKRAVDLARGRGCDWICFDVDGLVLTELPVFDQSHVRMEPAKRGPEPGL